MEPLSLAFLILANLISIQSLNDFQNLLSGSPFVNFPAGLVCPYNNSLLPTFVIVKYPFASFLLIFHVCLCSVSCANLSFQSTMVPIKAFI